MEIDPLHVPVEVGHDGIEVEQSGLDGGDRAETVVFLGVPQREDHGPRRWVGGEAAADLDHRGNAGGVVASAVAHVVAGDVGRAVVAEVVVVGAEQHDLLGGRGALDEAKDVGALLERMEEAVGPGQRLGHRLELLDESVLDCAGPFREVVAPVAVLDEERHGVDERGAGRLVG